VLKKLLHKKPFLNTVFACITDCETAVWFALPKMWPLNSPELNPLDYYVCEEMLEVNHIYGPKLKISSNSEMLQLTSDSLTQDRIDRAVKEFLNRLNARVVA